MRCNSFNRAKCQRLEAVRDRDPNISVLLERPFSACRLRKREVELKIFIMLAEHRRHSLKLLLDFPGRMRRCTAESLFLSLKIQLAFESRWQELGIVRA